MKKKILVVDDEKNILEPVREVLEEEGYLVDTVTNGAKALEVYQRSLAKHPYDLILLDIVMPRVSGLEVLNSIRKNEEARGVPTGKGVPIIMLSGLRESWLNDSYQDGCNDYIIKPYDPDLLISKVKKMLGEKD
ncbi:MAG: response regulator [Candidatus Omnitrophica bacterium]|nr:response regulator [Candidatus Omnitrophota bacterium]